MKFLISERQSKLLVEESPIKIGCHDYDLIPKYCGTLKLTKQHGDMIISKNRQSAKNNIINKLNTFIEEAKKETKEYKEITNKFTEAIEACKNDIITYLDNVYSNAVYTTVGVQPYFDTNKLMLALVKILSDSFNKVWNESFFIRNAAMLFVTKKNIKMVKESSKNVWYEWIQKFASLIDYYFLDNIYLPIRDLVTNLNKSKSLPVCKKVIVTADIYCNKLPSDKWYNPKIKYDDEFDINPSSDESIKNVSNVYWPKISAILDSLV